MTLQCEKKAGSFIPAKLGNLSPALTASYDVTHTLAMPVSSHAHLARETPPPFMLILHETTLRLYLPITVRYNAITMIVAQRWERGKDILTSSLSGACCRASFMMMC